MADRLTQLQDMVNQVSAINMWNMKNSQLILILINFQQAENLCNSIGKISIRIV
jgi:hypothetical protein